MKAPLCITEALADASLLGAALGDLQSWETWLAVLRAAFGLNLTDHEREIFTKVAGGRRPPSRRVSELWAVVGRRSGKSRMAAALAVFIACLTDCRAKLAKGEQGMVLVMAPTLAQAKIIFDYALAFITASPLLASQLEGEPTQSEIRLRGGITIAVHPASFRSVRGRTLIAAIADETAYWRSETAALPDYEAIRAITPSLATTGGLLIGIGSPYRKAGILFAKHRDHYGVDGDDVLLVQGESRAFNPTLDLAVIEAAERDDPEAAASEWRAMFRSDLASLLDDQVIDASIECRRPLELPPRHTLTYHCFVDASAGRHDAFTVCIGHAENDLFVCDVIRSTKPPFDPGSVTTAYATVAKEYRCRRIVGDAFAGEWVAQAFRDAGATYEYARLSKSQLYIESVAYWNRGAVRIPNHAPLLRELRLLERRVHRSGKDSVDHPRNGSDDLSNALVGALHLAIQESRRPRAKIGYGANFGPIRWQSLGKEPERARIRLVHVDEHGNELTTDEVCALRHKLPGALQ
jgi:hypothetical protein